MPELRIISLTEYGSQDEAPAALAAAAGVGLLELNEALKPLAQIAPLWNGGARVQAGRVIGTVQVGQLRVDVAPRMAARELVTLIRYALGSQFDARRRSAIDVARTGLDELICALFAEELSFIRQAGLSRQYVKRTERLGVVRGGPDFLASFPWNDRGVTSLTCRFHELTCDTLDNQLVRAALERATLLETRVATRRKLLEHRQVWSAAASPKQPTAADFAAARASYTRLTEHYRLAHQLSELIMSGRRPESIFERGRVQTSGLSLDMAHLFELFVQRLLAEQVAASGLTVLPQGSDRGALLDAHGGTYHNVRPDIVVCNKGVPLAVIDAKYKEYWMAANANGAPANRISNEDLYQLFFYAQRLQFRHNLAAPVPAVIISPLPAGDARGGQAQIAAQYREVMCRAGHHLAGRVTLVLLPLSEMLRGLASGRRPTLRVVDGLDPSIATASR